MNSVFILSAGKTSSCIHFDKFLYKSDFEFSFPFKYQKVIGNFLINLKPMRVYIFRELLNQFLLLPVWF